MSDVEVNPAMVIRTKRGHRWQFERLLDGRVRVEHTTPGVEGADSILIGRQTWARIVNRIAPHAGPIDDDDVPAEIESSSEADV